MNFSKTTRVQRYIQEKTLLAPWVDFLKNDAVVLSIFMASRSEFGVLQMLWMIQMEMF